MPFDLSRDLSYHECSSVRLQGWTGIKNGILLRQAEQAGFHVLITLDDDIEGEQSMAGRNLSVLVLKPRGQGTVGVRELAPAVRKALEDIGRGQILRVQH